MVESENSENEENKPDEEKKPDEETKPDLSRFENFLYIDLEQIQAVIDDAQPMIEAFWTIWTEEKTGMVGVHGGMTKEEMFVPLIIFKG